MPKIPEYLNLPFEEAIAYLEKKVPMPSNKGAKFKAETHDHAFIVSGLTKAQLLEDIQWLLKKEMQSGKGIDSFKKSFNRLVGRKGWNPGERRVEIIYDTNLRRSHSAGRRQQMLDPDVLSQRPYWMWKHRNSPVPRPEHLKIDGEVYAANDPFWDKAYPPCGFGCRCGVFSLSEEDRKRMGKIVKKPPDPRIIADEGFRSAPGRSSAKERSNIIKEGLKNLSPELREKVETDFKQNGVL